MPNPVVASPEIKPKPSRTVLILSVLLIAMTCVAAVLGYLLFTIQCHKCDITETAEQQVDSTSPTMTIGQLSKTYTDDVFHFSFNYPEGLSPYEQSNGVVLFLPNENYEACKTADESKTSDFNAFTPCYSSAFNFNGFQVLDSSAQVTHNEWQIEVEYGEVYNISATSSIDGIPVKISFQKSPSDTATEQDAKTYIEQLVQTFRFTDPVGPLANWKTYSNNNFGISLVYPPTYTIEANEVKTNQSLHLIFNKNKSDTLVLDLTKQYLPNDTEYYLDNQPTNEETIAGRMWKRFYLPGGYGDGPNSLGVPTDTLRTEANGTLITATVFNRSYFDSTQMQILTMLEI